MVRTISSQTLNAGDKAPQFDLVGVDNQLYSTRELKSKTALIVFICNHCPYVRARIGDINNLQRLFGPEHLQVVGINSNDPNYQGEGLENMLTFSKQYNLNFPYLIDESQTVAKAYGAVCTPDPFLFDSELRLVYHGKINDATEPSMLPKTHLMENNIRKILNGEQIEKPFDPSIGCSIKWKETQS
jgi:peroxiredoxin